MLPPARILILVKTGCLALGHVGLETRLDLEFGLENRLVVGDCRALASVEKLVKGVDLEQLKHVLVDVALLIPLPGALGLRPEDCPRPSESM